MKTQLEALTDWPSLRRYFWFVFVTILFSFLAIGMANAPWQLGLLSVLDHVIFMLGFALFFGWIFWGPIALLAMFPGFPLYRWLARRMQHAGLSRRTIAVLVPIPIAAFSWLGLVVPVLMFAELSDLVGMTLFLAYGTPAAMLAGYLVMGQEWGRNER